MAEHNDLGKIGEQMAIEYLINKGYSILDTNWRFGNDELDIIARNKNTLIIVEVKTRRSNFFGEPEISVTKTKQKFMVRATESYIQQKKLNLEVRFDIIAIILNPNEKQINHIEDAFSAALL